MTGEAGRQRGGVVGDHAGRPAEGSREGRRARRARLAPRIDHEQLRVDRAWTGRSRRSSQPRGMGGRECGDNRVDELRRRVLRSLQRRRISVGHGERVQRRVHVAGIDATGSARLRTASSSSQIAAHVPQRGLAGAVGAPARVGVDRRVAGDVEHDGAAALAGGSGQRRRGALWSGGTDPADWWPAPLEVFAVGVGQQAQRHRPKVRGVVDQDVEATELAEDLQGDGIDVVFPDTSPTMPCVLGMVAGNALDTALRCGRRRRRGRRGASSRGRGRARGRRCRQ